MNVSWSKTYDTTNLYLIQGGDFNSLVGIVCKWPPHDLVISMC